VINPVEVIRKKRFGQALSAEELKEFFHQYLDEKVPDYQVSALLMAIAIQGMSREEASKLTLLMRDSGRILKWQFPRESIVDKHSTGGVGDKTSLIILPLAVLEDLKVPMMSGRGLGHTGGTLDKLEAIPGVNVRLEIERAEKVLNKWGGVFIGQTGELAPLDKKLYALRDVTGTVESIPLITASILSKKTAEGIGNLVMDVKFGSGAFIPEFEKAKELAASLMSVGEACGLRMRCLITSMNSPLGGAAGHNCEILECIEILKGGGPADTVELSLALTAEMVQMAFPKREKSEIMSTLKKHLASGAAFERFCKIIAEQGGDTSYLEKPEKFKQARLSAPVFASQKGGYVTKVNVRNLGLAILELGGGRRQVHHEIDHAVGLTELKRVGDSVQSGEPVAMVHANDEKKLEQAKQIIAAAYECGDQKITEPLIKERIP
jgi:pyrimidine-nucleoside phosphorylase